MQIAEQIRAARALLRWDQTELAARAGASIATVRRVENYPWDLPSDSLAMRAIKRALVDGGIQFLDEDDQGGLGVRLQRQRPNTFEPIRLSEQSFGINIYGMLIADLDGKPIIIISNPPHLHQISITNVIEHVVEKIIFCINNKTLPDVNIIYNFMRKIFINGKQISDYRWFQFYPPEALEYENHRCREVKFKLRNGQPTWDDAPKEVLEIALHAHQQTDWSFFEHGTKPTALHAEPCRVGEEIPKINYSASFVAEAVSVAAEAVGMTVSQLNTHCLSRTGASFNAFLGEERGGYRPSFYNSDNRILADAYDAGRKFQGDPRRAFRGL